VRSRSLFAALAFFPHPVCIPAFAGPVTGRILDPSGRPVAGAQVIVNTERGIVRARS
jgi:hypothetical protein